jgi:exodeoxyribonuclease V gamma subunit
MGTIWQNVTPPDRKPCEGVAARTVAPITLPAHASMLTGFYPPRLGVRDNAVKPPSVVVAELLDELASMTGIRPDRFVVRHPLQPFSARYFTGSDERLFSYGADALAAATTLAGSASPPQPFASGATVRAHGSESDEPLALVDLTRFFRRSSRHFLREALGLRVDQVEAPERDREPSTLEPLTRWQVGNALLSRGRDGENPDTLHEYFAAGGQLPPGELGRLVYDDVLSEVSNIARREAELHGSDAPGTLEIDLDIEGTRLVGRIGGVNPRGRVVSGYGRLGSLSELDAWIEHLAMSAMGSSEARPVTWLLGRASGSDAPIMRFEAVDDPETRLGELVALHRAGQIAPLPFFPKTSRKYADRRTGDETAEREAIASKDAYRAFRGDDGDEGERAEDASIRLLFADRDPLASSEAQDAASAGGAGFREVATRVFGPLLSHRKSGA